MNETEVAQAQSQVVAAYGNDPAMRAIALQGIERTRENQARGGRRSGKHVVRKLSLVHTKPGPVTVEAFLGAAWPSGYRPTVDARHLAEQHFGAKDAERLAAFAGPEWHAVSVAELNRSAGWAKLDSSPAGLNGGVGL